MLNKHFEYSFIILFIICLFNGCSEKDPDKYYNSKDDYSIKFPKEWETKEGFMGTSVISFSPQENSADEYHNNVNVMVEQLSSSVDLDEYFKASANSIRRVITDFQENEKGNTSINETDAKWLIYSGRMGTLNLKNKVYLMVHKKRGYAITCGATPDGFYRYKNTFDDIVQSFEFE